MMLLTLLGEQPIPNLLPLWQFRQMDGVRFAASERTQPLAQSLAEFIRSDPQLRSLTVFPPLILPAYDLPAARQRIGAAIAEIGRPPGELVINLTGGTKLMSLAAMQAAYGQATPLMYVSAEQNQVLFYSSDGVEIRREPIRVSITVEQYLRAHGIEVSETQSFRPQGGADERPPREGDWLEQAIFEAASGSRQFDDVRRNLFIRRASRSDYVTNELDIVVTRNGMLAVCSCKSGKVEIKDLYELEALSSREKFGIYCGKVFAAFSGTLPAAFKNRAAADHIRLAFGGDVVNQAVKQLVESLKRF